MLDVIGFSRPDTAGGAITMSIKKKCVRRQGRSPLRWLFRRFPQTETSLQFAKPSKTLRCIWECSLPRSAATLRSHNNTLPPSCSPLNHEPAPGNDSLPVSEKPSCDPAHETIGLIKPISANKPECFVLILIILPPPTPNHTGG